jgi:hypothetical protein
VTENLEAASVAMPCPTYFRATHVNGSKFQALRMSVRTETLMWCEPRPNLDGCEVVRQAKTEADAVDLLQGFEKYGFFQRPELRRRRC